MEMVLGAIELVECGPPLETALAAAFSRIRAAGAIRATLLFDLAWRPTMEAVDIVARELGDSRVATLTLVHPSASMSFIASAIGMRVRSVEIRAQRSIHDDEEDVETTDATESRTQFFMSKHDVLKDFVRRSVTEAKSRIVRRFVLVFDAGVPIREMELVDVLAEELLNAGVEEVGLIHLVADLETVAAALRLRVPSVRVAVRQHAPPRKA